MRYTFFITLMLIIICGDSFADTVYLKNGDKVTGEIVEEAEDFVKVGTEAMGEVLIDREFIQSAETSGPAPAAAQSVSEKSEEPEWAAAIAAGINAARGNTDKSAASGSFFVNRNRYHVDEWTAKGSMYYSESDDRLDAQKWYLMGRYAYSFGPKRHWYNFYKFESDHDRFANIDYRLIPSAGLGYWFVDTEDFQLMAECGAGLEHTGFRDDTSSENEAILVPRAYFKKKLLGESVLVQDVLFYPSLEEEENYRFHSETKLKNPFTDKLSLNLSFINDYNSDPPEDVKKHDLSVITSLEYSF